ncbi:MAG: hypothetical protein EON56_00270 [Alphaproteobacteria bacterium]|nr:MAG: hypothetical protein EON56_00270 [Alphaproteobacteria bacterium]
MAGSFNKIDYRLRPAKHAERQMFVELIRRLRFTPTDAYKYVGFGSVGFIDFRLFYRALGVTDMVSIEGTDEPEEQARFQRNIPHECVRMEFGMSSAVLPTIDFSTPSIVWLDYDNALRRSMASDLALVAGQAASGTFLAVSVVGALAPNQSIEQRDREVARLKSQFKEFLAPDATHADLIGKKFGEFVRVALGQIVRDAVADADAGLQVPEDARQAYQACYFTYRDGLPMLSLGWLIVAEKDRQAMEDSQLAGLSFHRDGADAYVIDVPIVTPLELREMEKRLPNLEAANDLDWIPLKQREAFARSARYLPHYVSIEPS